MCLFSHLRGCNIYDHNVWTDQTVKALAHTKGKQNWLCPLAVPKKVLLKQDGPVPTNVNDKLSYAINLTLNKTKEENKRQSPVLFLS